MTFFDFIRNSLLDESRRSCPPGILAQLVFGALQKKERCAGKAWAALPEPARQVEESKEKT